MAIIALGPVEVSLETRRVRAPEGDNELTALEAEVLRYLAGRPNLDVGRDELLAGVWGYASGARSRAVDHLVRRLRQKLGAAGHERLLTVHGVGYRLILGEERPATPAQAREPVRLRGGQLDPDRRLFLPEGGAPVELSPQEGLVLDVLLEAPGFVLRERIESLLWRRPTRHAFQALIGRMRRKLGDALDIRRGWGLRLVRQERAVRLPEEHDRFVERVELEQAEEALRGSRVVALRGPPGVGKSRLALALARRQPAAVWVPLAGSAGRASFLHAVARALQIALVDPDPVAQIGRVLGLRDRTLLFLDNFDPLTGETAILTRWLELAPALRLVITSRCTVPLQAAEVNVQPLPQDAAVELFVSRATAACPSAELDPEQIAQLVCRLDRLPLAIELAAARVEQLGSLSERLHNPLDLLCGARSELTPHSTLRGALDWSWALLSQEEQEALEQLALFRGIVPVELLDEPVVARLFEHSLAQRDRDGFSLSSTLRLYGRERFALRPDRDQRLRAWTERLLAHADDACGAVYQPDRRRDGLHALRLLRDDLWALVVGEHDLESQVRATCALMRLLENDGQTDALLEPLRALSARTRSTWVELNLGRELYQAGELEAALVCVERVLSWDPGLPNQLRARRLRASIWRLQGLREQAVSELSELVGLAERWDERARCLINLGNVLTEFGRVDPALQAWRQAEELALAGGCLELQQSVLVNRGFTLLIRGDWEVARASGERSIDLARQLECPSALASGLRLHACALRGLGDLEGSDRQLALACAELRQIGSGDSRPWWYRATLALERGRDADAERWFEEALSRGWSDPCNAFALRSNQAVGWLATGQDERALAVFRALEPRMEPETRPDARSIFLGFFAVALAAVGERDEAQQKLQHAERLICPARPSMVPLLALVRALVCGEPLPDTPRGDQFIELLLRISQRWESSSSSAWAAAQ